MLALPGHIVTKGKEHTAELGVPISFSNPPTLTLAILLLSLHPLLPREQLSGQDRDRGWVLGVTPFPV